MKRIAVIGCSGAGKSTFSRRLGQILDHPVTHLDTLHWQPGWISPDKAEWTALNHQLVKAETWIIDGNYGGTIDIRLEAADTIIYLDTPRWRCIWGFLYRCAFDRKHPDLPPDCPEPLFPGKEMRQHVQYLWRYPIDKRPATLTRLEQHSHTKRIITLKSRRDAQRFLSELSNSNPTD
jgi:adenylate kinase family enzyme